MKPSAISHQPSVSHLVGVLLCAAAGPLAGQMSLSIYKDGRVVVRQSLPQPLAKGRSTLSLKVDGLDPATLFSPDSGVAILSATLRPPTDRAAALRAAVGRTLSFVRAKGDTVSATVIRVDPPQYRLADGRLLLSEPGEPLFPAEAKLVRTAAEVSVVVDAASARPRTQLAYVSQGVSWEALYQVQVSGDRGQVSGTATVTSQNVNVDSAEVQLVAGTINRARVSRQAGAAAYMARQDVMAAAPAPEYAVEQAVGETHVYLLPDRLSLEPGVPVATALFPRTSVPVTRELIVPGVLPWQGWLQQTPAEPNRVPVQVWYTLKRGRGTPFGDRPLPAGTVQLFQADSAGRLLLVGEATNNHTAPGRDLRVQSGDAFDVTAERVQTDYNQEQLPPAQRGLPPRRRVTAAYKVTITNVKSEPVTVDVRESRYGVWRIVESSAPPEKLSATEQRFRVTVPVGGEATLTYSVQFEQ
ncbi:MAG: hypothetical protein AUH46_06145 [Gemmatimonadetes bacterium 13_1_40CM_70_15]|nr:MAG: hypothetical protein AUH46_06145 [Gemmatimonadetes bacterium 13_1_40CM_70_15]